MSDRIHIAHLLQDYLDGALTPAERQTVEAHLPTCPACQAEHESLASVRAAVGALPRSIEPPSDLWPEIEARISDPLLHEAVAGLEQRRNGPARRASRQQHPRRARFRAWYAAALVVVFVGGASAWWLLPHLVTPAWEVARLEGTPRVGETPLADTGKLHPGEWLETDDHSRAALDIGVIGNVEVEPNTRLQLVEANPREHRLALEAGTIHARIWAPPRLFFVETPSALAIDLGCTYTLYVDSTGGSLLHVTSGYVELQHEERTSVVPQGSMCLTRPGLGPGTPFDEDASEAFREALNRLDFEDGGADALTALLAEARLEDTATLWRLMYEIDPTERGRLYDRLVELVPPPDGITREAVLRADIEAIRTWDLHLGLDLDDGWFLRFFKKIKARAVSKGEWLIDNGELLIVNG